MWCKNCGKEISGEMAFCPNCGTKMKPEKKKKKIYFIAVGVVFVILLLLLFLFWGKQEPEQEPDHYSRKEEKEIEETFEKEKVSGKRLITSIDEVDWEKHEQIQQFNKYMVDTITELERETVVSFAGGSMKLPWADSVRNAIYVSNMRMKDADGVPYSDGEYTYDGWTEAISKNEFKVGNIAGGWSERFHEEMTDVQPYAVVLFVNEEKTHNMLEFIYRTPICYDNSNGDLITAYCYYHETLFDVSAADDVLSAKVFEGATISLQTSKKEVFKENLCELERKFKNLPTGAHRKYYGSLGEVMYQIRQSTYDFCGGFYCYEGDDIFNLVGDSVTEGLEFFE